MLNIGIIGITEVLEPHVKRIQKNKNINVIGKASIGTNTQLNSFHFSIPEFNRVELIERADILLVDDSSLLPYDLLCDIVKKGKHIFMTEYLNLSFDECKELLKLTNESRSVVQVSNPYYYLPGVQWLNKNFRSPFFLDVWKFSSEKSFNETILPLLLMLTDLVGLNPKKLNAISFRSNENKHEFTNVRLDYGNASTVNLNFGNQIAFNKFSINGFSNDQYVSMDFNKDIFLLDNHRIDLSKFLFLNEFDSYIHTITTQNNENGNLEDYLLSKLLALDINKKVSKLFA